jgi:hypothetical protein
MADDVILPAASGTRISTSETTTLNGLVVTAQHVHRVALSIRTGAATVVDLSGDATYGLDADVTRQVPAGGATATVTKADASETAATLAAADATRRALLIKNDSPNRLYLKYGGGADWQNSFTDWVEPAATWVMPEPLYTGEVSGVWEPAELGYSPQSNFGRGAVSGQAYVTHVVP